MHTATFGNHIFFLFFVCFVLFCLTFEKAESFSERNTLFELCYNTPNEQKVKHYDVSLKNSTKMLHFPLSLSLSLFFWGGEVVVVLFCLVYFNKMNYLL